MTYKVFQADGRFYIRRGAGTPDDPFQYFNGYDFMGSVNWEQSPFKQHAAMSREEASQIVSDLEAADMPARPIRADEEFLVKVAIDEETFAYVTTGRKIAEIYETDQIAGVYSRIDVWDIQGDPKKIDLYDLVEPILEQKRWMEQEYRDYCDNVNEYGLDFEGRDE